MSFKNRLGKLDKLTSMLEKAASGLLNKPCGYCSELTWTSIILPEAANYIDSEDGITPDTPPTHCPDCGRELHWEEVTHVIKPRRHGTPMDWEKSV